MGRLLFWHASRFWIGESTTDYTDFTDDFALIYPCHPRHPWLTPELPFSSLRSLAAKAEVSTEGNEANEEGSSAVRGAKRRLKAEGKGLRAEGKRGKGERGRTSKTQNPTSNFEQRPTAGFRFFAKFVSSCGTAQLSVTSVTSGFS